MFGHEVEPQSMCRVGEKRTAGRASAKGFGVERQVAPLGHELAQVQAPVRVEVVHNPVETRLVGELAHDMSHMISEVEITPCQAEVAD